MKKRQDCPENENVAGTIDAGPARRKGGRVALTKPLLDSGAALLDTAKTNMELQS